MLYHKELIHIGQKIQILWYKVLIQEIEQEEIVYKMEIIRI